VNTQHANTTLCVWRVRPRQVPALVWRLSRERRRAPGFAKLLGTGRDRRFGPSSVDPTRWATLVVGDPPPGREDLRLSLRPITSRGRWSGQEPFGGTGEPADGLVLALTRARLRPSRAVRFWRALDAPARAVDQAPGLLAAFGIGEAPLGWPGTVSLWRSTSDLVEFAYRQSEHRQVIDRSPTELWYAEELFARFAVVRVSGNRNVIGWNP
jgi:hypothetical protein